LRAVASSLRITPAGAVLVLLVLASLAVALFGPRRAQDASFAVALVALLVIAVGAFPGAFRSRRRI
jgi:hypothetical protein